MRPQLSLDPFSVEDAAAQDPAPGSSDSRGSFLLAPAAPFRGRVPEHRLLLDLAAARRAARTGARTRPRARARRPENEFMFFTSVFVPSFVSPRLRTLMFASTRRLPSSMFTSLTSTILEDLLEARRYAPASAAERMSGSLTISMSGTPARLRSMAVDAGKRSWIDLPGVLLHVHARDADREFADPLPRRLPMPDPPPVASGWSNCEIW